MFKISVLDHCAPFHLTFCVVKSPLSVRRELFCWSRMTLPFLGLPSRFLSSAFLPQCWLSYSLESLCFIQKLSKICICDCNAREALSFVIQAWQVQSLVVDGTGGSSHFNSSICHQWQRGMHFSGDKLLAMAEANA